MWLLAAGMLTRKTRVVSGCRGVSTGTHEHQSTAVPLCSGTSLQHSQQGTRTTFPLCDPQARQPISTTLTRPSHHPWPLQVFFLVFFFVVVYQHPEPCGKHPSVKRWLSVLSSHQAGGLLAVRGLAGAPAFGCWLLGLDGTWPM